MGDRQHGFVMYFDSIDALNRQIKEGIISAADAFSVVAALSSYAQTGRDPEKGTLSPVASMAYAMMIGSVRKSLKNYAEKSERNRQAARARWNASASPSVRDDAKDANACECTSAVQIELNRDERNLPPEDTHAREDEDGGAKRISDAVRLSHDMDALEWQWKQMGERVTESTLTWFDRLLCVHGVDAVLAAMKKADSVGAKMPRPYVEKVLSGPKTGGSASPRAAPSFEIRDGKTYYEGLECLE